MLLKKVKGRPVFFLPIICLILIKHQPFLYLTAASPGSSACIGTVSAPVITSGTFVTRHYVEIYGSLSLSPGVGCALGDPLIAPAYNITGPYNIAWIITTAFPVVMTAFLLYFYRGSYIYIKGQEEAGNMAKIQYNNGKVR